MHSVHIALHISSILLILYFFFELSRLIVKCTSVIKNWIPFNCWFDIFKMKKNKSNRQALYSVPIRITSVLWNQPLGSFLKDLFCVLWDDFIVLSVHVLSEQHASWIELGSVSAIYGYIFRPFPITHSVNAMFCWHCICLL